MNELTLSSSNRGFASTYLWSALWSVILYLISSYCSNRINGIDWDNALRYRGYHDLYVAALYIGDYVPLVLIAIIVLSVISTILYSSREKNTFYKDLKGNWSKVRCETFSFPFSKSQKDQAFDRVTSVEVEQTLVDRLMKTGTLSLELVTYTNADSDRSFWTIPAINDPYQQKALIEAGIMAYDGLSVKISQPQT